MDFKEKFESVKKYFLEVFLEGKRITWPSRKDTVKGTYIVLITVIISAIFLGIVDIGLAKIIQAFLK
ncbi:MAG: preprotein translocase subunit SecE [Syntrophorhabdaceae bacterium]|nr:preprotein translocase subunit SecE [Syntrophorhabdaceae bacterium]